MPIKSPPKLKRLKDATPKEKYTESLKNEAKARLVYGTHTSTLATPSLDPSSRLDCIFHDMFSIRAVCEIKGRSESLESIKRFDTYLISSSKLENGIIGSTLFGVPFVLLVPLQDGLCSWIITNGKGKKRFFYEVEDKITQKNIKGGKIEDRVALLPFEEMDEFIPWSDYEEEIKTLEG